MKIPTTAITLVPPGPVTDKTDIEIRGTVRNATDAVQSVTIEVYLESDKRKILFNDTRQLQSNQIDGFSFFMNTAGLTGQQLFTLECHFKNNTISCQQELEIIPSEHKSTGLISGAWVSLLLWSEEEGAKWNDMLRTFKDDDWREVMRGMHDVGMDVVVVQETWRNPVWYGEHYHQMTLDNYQETYQGKAFYPSELWPAKMDLPINDPLEAILDEADKLNMHVLLGVGMYAHFDYTPGSLAWHKDVVTELWQRYGHHNSLYGWYISEELAGSIKPHEMRYWDRTEQFREEVITFFSEFRKYCDSFAPDKVIMLAPSVQDESFDLWAQVAENCNIIAVQGYQRQDANAMPHEESIAQMQAICKDNGSHLWMDMEIFGFEHPDKEGPQTEGYDKTMPDGTEAFIQVPLIPQNIETSIKSLKRINQLEFTIAFQYPGLMCHPEAKNRLGGDPAVKYFEEYKNMILTKGYTK